MHLSAGHGNVDKVKKKQRHVARRNDYCDVCEWVGMSLMKDVTGVQQIYGCAHLKKLLTFKKGESTL